MKKLFLFVMSVFMLASCGDDANLTGGGEPEKPTNSETRATQVLIQGREYDYTSQTRAFGEQQTEKAYFFIRIDNSDEEEKTGLPDASNYWPQTAQGGSVFASGNTGTVDLTYPYFGTSSNYEKYVYDTKGEATLKALVNVPSIQDLISANKNRALDLSKVNLDEYKIIWYVVKKYEGVWHVDGLLTKKTTTDASEVLPDLKDDNKDLDNKADEPSLPEEVVEGNGNIEVNIHQQEHQTWDEIKTSIHVRDLVDEVKVEIPIDYAHVAEADDFALRTYDFELASKVFINGHEYSELGGSKPIEVKVAHEADKIVITIKVLNKDYITALRKEYGDGITVEVHSYPKGLDNATVWSKIKQSTVTVSPASYDSSNIKKLITSAFYEE